MTPFDYLTSRDDADELIQEFAPSGVMLRKITNSGTAYEPTQTPTDYPTYAARVAFTFAQLQGGDVLATDTRWLVAAGPLTALGVEPADGDTLVGVGTIVKVDPLNPDGIAVMFDCKVRV